MLRKLLSLVGLWSIHSGILPSAGLPCYKKSDHFNVFCIPLDHEVAEEMISEGERYLSQLAIDFGQAYNDMIDLKIYPDLAAFHGAIGWPDAPHWVIGRCWHRNIQTVSPRAPGPIHTYMGVMRIQRARLVEVYLHGIYTDFATVPRWLRQGVSLYVAGVYDPAYVQESIRRRDIFPTLAELESTEKNTAGFDELNGFFVSCSWVRFIHTQWGWPAIVQLLQNYEQFEVVLGLNKQVFGHRWAEWVQWP